MKNLLLDTCALLWLASGDPSLSPAARTRIEASELVFVSATSAWEVAEELTTTATPPTGSSSLRRSSTVSTW